MDADLDITAPDAPRVVAVLLHPHPHFGGNRFHPFVDGVHRRLPQAGVAAVRFDFISDDPLEAEGRVGDAIDDSLRRWPGKPIGLIGYSFGAGVAAGIVDERVAGWFLLAPQEQPLAASGLGADPRPKRIVVPEHDQFCPPPVVRRVVADWRETTVSVAPGTDHFLGAVGADRGRRDGLGEGPRPIVTSGPDTSRSRSEGSRADGLHRPAARADIPEVGRGSSIGPDFDGVLAAASTGAEWAFERLYRDLNPRLVRYLGSQAPGAAEDLAAETWMGAARNLRSFEGGEDAFRAWLFKIAHRRLVQHWRDEGRDRSVTTDPYSLLDRPDGAPAAEDSVVAADSVARAARRVAAILTPDQAQVVLLRILGDLSVEQVATVLGKRAGTVRVLQHKALKKLAAVDFSLEAVTN